MAIFKYISKLINNSDPVIVMPFGGYANNGRIIAQARVLEDEGIQHSEEDSKIRNLWNSYKRFESDEKEGVCVKVSWSNHSVYLISDDEGYIYLDEPFGTTVEQKKTSWLPITYQLMEGKQVIHTAESEVMIPSNNADFGIISDIDDTILHTGVASTFKWRVLVNSFFKHSDKRLPLEGAQELYDKLYKGVSGNRKNPFFYLSNSPWNIYDYLTSFLTKFEFPKGVVLLRDIGINILKKEHFTKSHKYLQTIKILETYQSLNFILIGDAGEIDTDIYIAISRKYPERILSIYIRAVNKSSKIKRIARIIEENNDVEVLLITEAKEALDHAKSKGYINPTV